MSIEMVGESLRELVCVSASCIIVAFTFTAVCGTYT